MITADLHVGYNQKVNVSDTDPDIPTNVHVYEEGYTSFPSRCFWWKVELRNYGHVSIIKYEPINEC